MLRKLDMHAQQHFLIYLVLPFWARLARLFLLDFDDLRDEQAVEHVTPRSVPQVMNEPSKFDHQNLLISDT